MQLALRRLETDQTGIRELTKASEELVKVFDEANIRLLMDGLSQKITTEMYELLSSYSYLYIACLILTSYFRTEKEVEREEKLMVKQIKRNQREAEKEKQRTEKEQKKERLQRVRRTYVIQNLIVFLLLGFSSDFPAQFI